MKLIQYIYKNILDYNFEIDYSKLTDKDEKIYKFYYTIKNNIKFNRIYELLTSRYGKHDIIMSIYHINDNRHNHLLSKCYNDNLIVYDILLNNGFVDIININEHGKYYVLYLLNDKTKW